MYSNPTLHFVAERETVTSSLLLVISYDYTFISGCFKNDYRRKTLFLREMGSKYLYHKYHEEQYGNPFVQWDEFK